MIYKIFITVIRSAASYIFLLILARIIGRKLISKITFFDFLIGVALGSLAVRISLGEHASFILGIISALTITILVMLTDTLNIKSYKFRKLEEGQPVILISKGTIIDSNLRSVKISINKLMMLLREKDVFNISAVEYAIFENDGELSILLKSSFQNAKASDLNLPDKNTELPLDLIIDGKIIYNNLSKAILDTTWLDNQLNSLNISSAEETFYCCLKPDGSLYASAKNQKMNTV